MDGVVGRERELAAVGGLLDGVDGGPAVLLLAGAAGIGKTTVWQAGVDAAVERGFTVAVSRPSSAEVRLSYAGLADLLAAVDRAVFDRLPAPQRRALDAALLRDTDPDAAPDPRAVAAGVLSALDTLARTGPAVVAIDDLQWLDEPTRRVVTFAVRRCTGPVAVLTAARTDDDTAPVADLCPRDPDRARTVSIGPLSMAALHHVIARKLDRRLPRPALARIAEISAGNPFYAVELARSVDLRAPGSTPLPASLRTLVQHRLGRLEPQVREALLAACALATPRVDLVERVVGTGDAARLLGAAEDAGVITLAPDGAITFTHPLLAAATYAEASPTPRRALHQQLSTIVDDVEERARHLARAALGPDPATVTALDTAAATARARGAPAAAAELLELAIDLGADDPARQVEAAQHHFHAGDPTGARALLEHAVAELNPGHVRAEALVLLGVILFDADASAEARGLLERALVEAGSDLRLRCEIALELTFECFNTGAPGAGLPHAMRTVEEAERVGDDGLLAEALATSVIARFLLGEGVDEAMLQRALALEDPDRRGRVNCWPTFVVGVVRWWSHRLDEALAAFVAARQRCLEHGLESELWMTCFTAGAAACVAGDLAAAARYTDELAELAELAGTTQAHGCASTLQAELAASAGRVNEARAAGEQALACFTQGTMATFPLMAVGALGMAELSVGDHEAAARWLAPAAEAMASAGIEEPAALPFPPDAVEALVALDRLDEAEPMVDLLEASGRRPGRIWAAAVGARCRGLLHAAHGDPDAATAAFDQALTAHDRLPQLRYDRARTLLTYGRHQRRNRQRRAAHTSLEEAARLFDAVGCTQWAATTRDELDRLGLKPRDGDELTPTETHVAELAATGMTVRDVAAALIVSPKTVEAHLTRIYRKLGIHTRAELARHIVDSHP